MNRVGDLIHKFEETDQTVADFNDLFFFCPLITFDPKSKVTIHELRVGSIRKITVDGVILLHDFDVQHRDKILPDPRRKKVPYVKKRPEVSVNQVVSSKEAKLIPGAYKVLQYIKGMEHNSFLQTETSKYLCMSTKSLSDYLQVLKDCSIIDFKVNKGSHTEVYIKGENKWKV